MPFCYSAFGLSILSDLELPELDPDPAAGGSDLIIRLATRQIDNQDDDVETSPRITPLEVYSRVQGIGRCWIRGGREIEIDPLPDIDSGVLRLFLLGTALGIILHQRGYLVLHGSTVVIGGKAVTFVGDSGWGKSTLAAAFHGCGYRIIGDDLAAIDLDDPIPRVLRGFPQIRLWPDSATAIGHDPDGLPRVSGDGEKRWVRPSHTGLESSFPLVAIFLLDRSESPGNTIPEIPRQDAVVELVRHSFTAPQLFLKGGAGAAGHFRQCAAVVRSIPVYRLFRTTSLEDLPLLVDRIAVKLNAMQ